MLPPPPTALGSKGKGKVNADPREQIPELSVTPHICLSLALPRLGRLGNTWQVASLHPPAAVGANRRHTQTVSLTHFLFQRIPLSGILTSGNSQILRRRRSMWEVTRGLLLGKSLMRVQKGLSTRSALPPKAAEVIRAVAANAYTVLTVCDAQLKGAS